MVAKPSLGPSCSCGGPCATTAHSPVGGRNPAPPAWIWARPGQWASKQEEARRPLWPSPEGAQAGRRGLGRVACHPCPCPHGQPGSHQERGGGPGEEGTGIYRRPRARCGDGRRGGLDWPRSGKGLRSVPPQTRSHFPGRPLASSQLLDTSPGVVGFQRGANSAWRKAQSLPSPLTL